jgi:hypothetical protein
MLFAEFSSIRQKPRSVHLKLRITRPENKVFPVFFMLREGGGRLCLAGIEKRGKNSSVLRCLWGEVGID